jgi:hypothetical protein
MEMPTLNEQEEVGKQPIVEKGLAVFRTSHKIQCTG